MATTAEGQAKLRRMLAAGMGRKQALTMLTNAQKKAAATPQFTPAEPQAPAPGWNWDEERGGFTPPSEAEGTSVTVPELGQGQMTSPQGVTTPIAAAQQAQPQWNVYEDPVYMQQLQGAQSAFNRDRINALASKERATLDINQELGDRRSIAEESRRRLAGNFAARGMAGGRAGALSREEAQMNARELRLRTSLRDQISELNREFVANYGAKPEDWLGTTRGASAQQDAVQAAINARLAGLTSVG
ncbi:MAG: hypothetical protein EBS38_08390 [Actinobacteria bacterium]|nr:hypothetical protein [Actinomycetota bacterium]